MKKLTLLVALFAAMNLSAQEPEWVAKIEIEGQPITSLNCQNLHELLKAEKIDKNKDMAVTFDREKSVLLFRNADIKWHDVQNLPFLKVEEKLTIVAEGTNSVEMKSANYFIFAKSDVTVQAVNTDEDKLLSYGKSWGQVAEDAPHSGICVLLDGNANLTLTNVAFYGHYFEHSLVGTKDANNKVTFDKASLFGDISKEVTLEINDMQFIGCEIKRPAGAAFSPELKGIAKDGKLVAGTKIAIDPISEDIDQITNDKSQITNKFFRDGQLYILRNGELFNANGTRVE